MTALHNKRPVGNHAGEFPPTCVEKECLFPVLQQLVCLTRTDRARTDPAISLMPRQKTKTKKPEFSNRYIISKKI